MIRVRHIFVSHPPHEKGQVTIWPLLRSGKNVKKQQEVSDLNQDYPRPWGVSVWKSMGVCCWPLKIGIPWYRSRSKVITCDTPSHASDHLYQIWKESVQNCRRYRADTIFKVKAEWPWKYMSRSKVITCDTPSDANDDLCRIWKERKQNCRFFFKVKAEKLQKLGKNLNFRILL